MAKDIISADGKSIFARQLGKKTVEIQRSHGKDKKSVFTITGGDYSIVGTPAKGKKATTVIVKDGEIDEEATTGKIATDADYDSKGNLRQRVEDLIRKYGDDFDPEKHGLDVDLEDYKDMDKNQQVEDEEGDENDEDNDDDDGGDESDE